MTNATCGRRQYAPIRRWRCGLSLLATLSITLGLIVARAPADEESEGAADRGDSKSERAARVEFMRVRAASLSAKVAVDDEVARAELVEPPLLHYNNLAGKEFDATVWAWGMKGRPIAVATLAVHRNEARTWNCEMVALADGDVTIAAKSGWRWAPARPGIDWHPVSKAPAAGKTAAVRGAQMKGIAERFSATGYYREGHIVELRLMGRPLLRYADPNQGLVDGALFAFADGTNPEVLLLVECRQGDDGKLTWVSGCARMSGGRLVVRLGEDTVWECPEIRGFNPEEPYTSKNGTAHEVFGLDPD